MTCDVRDALTALYAAGGPITRAKVAAVLALPGHGHHYVSTACQHDLHEQCREDCKFCARPCACPHHGITPPAPIPAPPATVGPPVRSGGLIRPTTRTLTPTQFLAEARRVGLIEDVVIAGSITLDDPRDCWTARNVLILGSGLYGIKSFHSTDAAPLNGTGTRWEHCEVDGRGVCSTAVLGSYLTWVDGNVHGATSDLFKPFRHVTVLRGQAHGIRKAEGAHADVIQIVKAEHVLFDSVWMDATLRTGEPDRAAVRTAAPGHANAVLQMGALSGDVTDVVIRNCWANGGHYTLRGLGELPAGRTVTGFRVEDNWLGPDHTYGPTHALSGYGAGNRWGFSGKTAKGVQVVLGQAV